MKGLPIIKAVEEDQSNHVSVYPSLETLIQSIFALMTLALFGYVIWVVSTETLDAAEKAAKAPILTQPQKFSHFKVDLQ